MRFINDLNIPIIYSIHDVKKTLPPKYSVYLPYTCTHLNFRFNNINHKISINSLQNYPSGKIDYIILSKNNKYVKNSIVIKENKDKNILDYLKFLYIDSNNVKTSLYSPKLDKTIYSVEDKFRSYLDNKKMEDKIISMTNQNYDVIWWILILILFIVLELILVIMYKV